jgi:hypothetical protein
LFAAAPFAVQSAITLSLLTEFVFAQAGSTQFSARLSFRTPAFAAASFIATVLTA